MLNQWNLGSHDASGFDTDSGLNGNGGADFLDIVDTQLDIGHLEGQVGLPEGHINLRLDILCLVNQFHQFPNQDIPFLIHQHIALAGKSKRVFGQY